MWDKTSLAWAAGFFEGEGSIGASTRADGQAFLQVQVGQVDREPLDKFVSVLGVGKVYGPITMNNRPGVQSQQQQYRVAIAGFEAVQQIMVLLWPWLSQRRRAQYAEGVGRYLAYQATIAKKRGPRSNRPRFFAAQEERPLPVDGQPADSRG